MIKLLSQAWSDELALLFRSAEAELIIVSPYFTAFGTQLLERNASAELLSRGKITFVTDLSPANICAAAAQPAALIPLHEQASLLQVVHLPNLHAKVYIADFARAIVTSGNFTAGGLIHNHEYGVLIEVVDIVTRIRQDIDQLAALGAQVTGPKLRTYARIAQDLLAKFEKKVKSARKESAREFEQAFRDAEDELITVRLAGGPITPVFEKTVMYLLKRYGALSTERMHPLIQAIHPDLCDDSVDRVINGQHFGKKWKHAVRRAQSHLKDRGEIERAQGLWRITERSATRR